MIVETARFGLIDVEQSSIISMPRGMFGFEDSTEYCLIQHGPDNAYMWMQSTADPGLAFVVVDPSQYFSDYAFMLSSVEAEYLDLNTPNDAMVLTTVNIEPGTLEVTANLAGPVVINSKSLLAMQVALDDERYGTKQVIVGLSDTIGDEFPKAA